MGPRAPDSVGILPTVPQQYNAIEHVWGVLEGHWDGDLLDEIETVLGFARTMTWTGKFPRVELVNEVYQKGIRLSAAEMKLIEQRVRRDPELGKWFLESDGRKQKLG